MTDVQFPTNRGESAAAQHAALDYQLDPVTVGSEVVGYSCKIQDCQNGVVEDPLITSGAAPLTGDTRPSTDIADHPKCTCNYPTDASGNPTGNPDTAFFSSHFVPADLDTEENAQNMLPNIASSVFSTSSEWHEIPLQSNVLFRGVCSSPENCKDDNTQQQQNCARAINRGRIFARRVMTGLI